MNKLTDYDLRLCVSRIPKDIRTLIKEHGLFIGGGFLRSTISGEKVNDIDLFGPSVEVLKAAAKELKYSRIGRIHETDNAITVLSSSRFPVQFITRWVYADADKLCNDFDFTVCQAVIGFANDKWFSVAGEVFYSDLAAKRLAYTFPQREEAAGGSILRVRKFLRRGYNIQAAHFAGVIARLIAKVDVSTQLASDGEKGLARVLTGLLREVDPLVVIDGVDALDEHEIAAEEGV